MEEEDAAMPTNLQAAGTNYFAAARQMSLMARANGGAGVDVSSVQPIAYWEQLFGALGGQDIGFGPGFTATQNIYQLYQENLYNEANALFALDMADTTTGDGINPNQIYPSNRFYHDQFSALYAWRSIGASNYNSLQVVYRQRFGLGLQADFNYTLSKSLDTTSQAERLGPSGGINNAQIFNTWSPNQLYGASDFDIRHQLNANYVWSLPFGQGQRYASAVSHLVNAFVGGWQTTGIVRWTSGLPFAVQNGDNYPTNYDIQGFATQIAKVPGGRGKLQQRFADPAATLAAFDFTLPGDSGTRNPLRGDGYFEIDAGLGKSFALTDRVKLKIGIEVFNVSNSVRFDAHSIRNQRAHESASRTVLRSRRLLAVRPLSYSFPRTSDAPRDPLPHAVVQSSSMKTVVLSFRLRLESLGLAAGTINQRLAAVRRLAYEAADSGLLSPELAGNRRVKGRKSNWAAGRATGSTASRPRLLLEKSNGEGYAASETAL